MALSRKVWAVCLLISGFSHLTRGFTDWEDYISQWQNDRMYPYGTDFLDTASYTNVETNINFRLPFYGRAYQRAFIVTHGHIELVKTHDVDPDHMYGCKADQTWPNGEYPNSVDPPFIGPYYSRMESPNPFYDPTILWRRLDPNEASTDADRDITLGMLGMISGEVRELVLGGHRFNATKGLVVTWENMNYDTCMSSQSCYDLKNTFQAAIVTDEWSTYVVYSYYRLDWVNAPHMGCNIDGIPDEDNTNCFSAQAGFNAGEGREFHSLPYSGTDDVRQLAEISGTPWGVLGRFYYEVDGMRPIRGGCTDEVLSETHWPPEIWPPHGSMVGGHPVYISGPCFREDHEPEPYDVVCKFGSLDVPGEIIANDPSRAFCIAPFMAEVGRINIYVSLYGAVPETFVHYGSYTIVPKHHTRPPIHLHNEGGSWLEVTPSELIFSWDPDALLFTHEEEAGGSTDLMIHIKLMGYQEVDSNVTKTGGEIIWQEMHTFETLVQNEGYYSFLPSNHHCDLCTWPWTLLPPVGVIEITRPGYSEATSLKIYSETTPVGWYMNDEMTSLHGEEWARDLCQEWYDLERESMEWTNDLVPCPTTRGHAYSDNGGFIIDADCKPDQMICPKLAIECLIGTFPKTDSWVSQCCYDEHDNLLMSGDRDTGSPALKAHPGGVLPYSQVYHIPTMSNAFRDKGPSAVCCHWSSEETDCVEHYLEVRPTPDLLEYKAAGHAIAFGDPHFQTFDGNEFTFNGHGEYWLLRVRSEDLPQHEHFNMQARLELPPKQHWGDVNATVMTSVAFQESFLNDQQYAKIEVRLNEEALDRKLTVLVRGQAWDFGHPNTMVQEYAGTSNTKTVIVNNDPIDKNHQSNFTILFQCGVGVEVADRDGFLHVIVTVPHSYYGYTEGLFGVWNDDADDDLWPPSSSSPIDPESGNENIHYNFGQKWETTYSDSLFTYVASKDWNHYRDPDFKPNFVEPMPPIWPPIGSNVTEDDVDAVCGETFVCRFDYKTTMRRDVGETSIHLQDWFHEIDVMSEPVPACGRLHVDNSIREFDHYLVGGVVQFTGCESGYTLRGHTTYTCTELEEGEGEGEEGAEWKPWQDVECKSNEEIDQETAMLVTAIVVPILLVIIIVACVLGFIYYRRRQKKKNDAPAETEPKTTAAVTSSAYATDYPGGTSNMTYDPERVSQQSGTGGYNLTQQDLQPARPYRPPSRPAQPYDQVVDEMHRSSKSSLGSTDAGPSGVPNVSMYPSGSARQPTPTGSMTRSRSYENNLHTPGPDPLKPNSKSKSLDQNMYNVGMSVAPPPAATGRTTPGGTPMYHTSHPSLAGSGDLSSGLDLTMRVATPQPMASPTGAQAPQEYPGAPPPPQRPPPAIPPGYENPALAYDDMTGHHGDASSSSQGVADPRESVHSQYTSNYPVPTSGGFGADTFV